MPEPLKPYLQQVIQDADELRKKTVNLNRFLDHRDSINDDERSLLEAQALAMATYHQVLLMRIAYLKAHPVLTLADSIADLNGTPRPDAPALTAQTDRMISEQFGAGASYPPSA